MLNDTCACPVIETEPLNEGTDVLEDDSVNFNLQPWDFSHVSWFPWNEEWTCAKAKTKI